MKSDLMELVNVVLGNKTNGMVRGGEEARVRQQPFLICTMVSFFEYHLQVTLRFPFPRYPYSILT